MEDLRTVVESLIGWTEAMLPDQDRAAQLAADLSDLMSASDPAGPVTRLELDRIASVCHRTARHLTFELHDEEAEPDRVSPGWPPVPRDEVERRAGFVRSVRLREGGRAGELRIDGFDDLGYARPYLQAAFTLLAGVDSLILDLRRNGGGAVDSLALVAEFVLGHGAENEHLVDVHYRNRPTRRWWTTGELGDTHVSPGARVAVLIGTRTYSSGEALAYHLTSRGRVHLIGERTPGAADHVTPVRITPHVTALVPEGTPIDASSGSNWEGVGVVPDTACAADDALSRAREWVES